MDLCHTWASWLIQQGTPITILKEMGGWESLEMVQKYAHLSSQHLQSHTDSLMMDWDTAQKIRQFKYKIKKPKQLFRLQKFGGS